MYVLYVITPFASHLPTTLFTSLLPTTSSQISESVIFLKFIKTRLAYFGYNKG